MGSEGKQLNLVQAGLQGRDSKRLGATPGDHVSGPSGAHSPKRYSPYPQLLRPGAPGQRSAGKNASWNTFGLFAYEDIWPEQCTPIEDTRGLASSGPSLRRQRRVSTIEPRSAEPSP